jgi:hypothetical protein
MLVPTQLFIMRATRAPDGGGLTPGQTGRLTVCHKITWTSTGLALLQVVGVSNETVGYGYEFSGTLTKE